MSYEPYLKFRWEKMSNHRYYEVYLARDLFGWCVTRVWGRKSTALGQLSHCPCDNYRDGELKIFAIQKQRKQHGYQLITQEVNSVEKNLE